LDFADENAVHLASCSFFEIDRLAVHASGLGVEVSDVTDAFNR
jgi:hypothetical protein